MIAAFMLWLARAGAALPGVLAGFAGWALKHWKPLTIALLAIGLWVQHGALTRETARRVAAEAAQINPATRQPWRVEAQRDARDVATCRGNAKRLEDTVKGQNAAVDAAKARGDAMAAEAERSAREARGARAVAESRARDVMGARVDAATCEAREAQLLELAWGSLK